MYGLTMMVKFCSLKNSPFRDVLLGIISKVIIQEVNALENKEIIYCEV